MGNALRTHAGLRTGIALAFPLLLASSAVARDVVFDFDTDGEPSTVESEITAEVGEVVIGYMVLNDFDEDYQYLGAIQFGLEITDGLELLGWQVMLDRAGVIHDGVDGIAVAFSPPYDRLNLPSFAMRFVVRVLSEEEQSVRIVPSTGWGRSFDGVLFVVAEDLDGVWVEIESETTVMEQLAARINPGNATPTKETSWGAIKRLFDDDTL